VALFDRSDAPPLAANRGSRLRVRLRWTAFLLAWATLFLLTSIPGEKMPNPGIPFWDKWAHGLAYACLGLLLWRLVRAVGRPRSAPARFLVVAGFCAAYGFIDEIHQLWVPRRACDPADMLMDALGGSLAASASFLPERVQAWLDLGLPPSDYLARRWRERGGRAAPRGESPTIAEEST
jgi:VanZ family protein